MRSGSRRDVGLQQCLGPARISLDDPTAPPLVCCPLPVARRRAGWQCGLKPLDVGRTIRAQRVEAPPVRLIRVIFRARGILHERVQILHKRGIIKHKERLQPSPKRQLQPRQTSDQRADIRTRKACLSNLIRQTTS